MRLLMRTLCCLALLAAPASAQAEEHVHADGSVHTGSHAEHAPAAARTSWPAEAVAVAGRLPVQDGGRIKPLSTYAGFTLLRLAGKRTLSLSDGQRIASMEWLLDVLFRPELARAQRVFLVQDADVLAAIGVDVEGRRKRDRYSFEELRPGVPQLFDLAHRYGGIEPADRSSLQEQVVFLAESVNTFLGLVRHMDFARAGLRLDGSPRLVGLFGGRDFAPFHELLARTDELVRLHGELGDGHAAEPERRVVADVLQGLDQLAASASTLALFPPTDPAAPDWLAPADLLRAASSGEVVAPEHLEALHLFGRAALSVADPTAFTAELGEAEELLRGLAEARGEAGKLDLELSYYRSRPLTRSLVFFLGAFLCAAVSWLRPRGRLLYLLTWLGTVAGTAYLVAAIVMRCLIRGRPPVSTLYETVLFVAAVGVILALAVEWLNRQRVALSAGAILGMVGLFLANGYEVLDKRDTMPSLVAVLDTNFWLATHVTAITVGYSAGMFAALLASIYLVGKVCGWKRTERAFYRGLGRMVYGVLAFALIFSLVGTVLGGIWANDSWGRFWGWDPKENGALLIVISQIAILHARMGGFLREHGLCMAAAFGGTVIAFSWWGVNLLGVGLHSYGFTSGIHSALWTYYLGQWAVVGLGGIAAWRARGTAARPGGGAVRELPRAAAPTEGREAA